MLITQEVPSISVLRGLLILILVSVNIDGYAESVAGTDRHCPKASDRASRFVQYGNLSELITAPASKDEVREQFRSLDNSVKEQRYAAIMALALAGNIELFDRLVAKQDRDGLSVYASY